MPLRGSGVARPPTLPELSPSAVAFGEQATKTVSGPKTVTVTNRGKAVKVLRVGHHQRTDRPLGRERAEIVRRGQGVVILVKIVGKRGATEGPSIDQL